MPSPSTGTGTGTGGLPWRRPVLMIAAATAVVVVAMVVTGMGPTVLLVVALAGLLGVTVWLTIALGDTVVPAPPWPRPRPATPAATRSATQVSALRARLTHRRHAAGAERVHALLVDLIDDQLATSHGIDRHRDAAAARAILGDELYDFAADPSSARSLTRRRVLERVVTRIEAL